MAEKTTTQDRPELMTIPEVLGELRISRTTWQKLVRKGETPPITKVGAVQRVRRDAFDQWLREQAAA